MSPDLAAPLRTAVVGTAAITSLLPAYQGSFPVFTRRPAPADAPYPMVVISPDVSLTDVDGVNDQRPVHLRDIVVYGQNDTAAKYRTVEDIAMLLRSVFHRQRNSISVSGWHVVEVVARGPQTAPTDDDKTVGRVVSLTIQLAKGN